jgi:hypothetical protein
MKKVIVAAALSVGFTAVSHANDNAPVALTDTEMDQIVAAGGGPGHQAAAIADLEPGEVATLMPAHVVGEQPGEAHQSGASSLKSGVTEFAPSHVRKNP